MERTGGNFSRALGITGWKKNHWKMTFLSKAAPSATGRAGKTNTKPRQIPEGPQELEIPEDLGWDQQLCPGNSQAQRVGNSQLEKEAGDSEESKLTLWAVLPSRNAERFLGDKRWRGSGVAGKGLRSLWGRDLSPKIPGWSSVPA